MRYLVIEIPNPSSILPKVIYSENDPEGYDVRKIHLYDDGRIGYADEDNEVGDTILGDRPMPSTEELDSWENGHAYEITKDEFERLWQKYVVGCTGEA